MSFPMVIPLRVVTTWHCSFGFGCVLAEKLEFLCSDSCFAICPTCISRFLIVASEFFKWVEVV
ncbi:hypothetical protein Fmac_027084 [Flemingia macrophylla]|uniref:Uncharacterized protein n=1 Tax=Flemingia macrophylla TaxID=520843 RepID=A0ABD1LGP2_9FABA